MEFILIICIINVITFLIYDLNRKKEPELKKSKKGHKMTYFIGDVEIYKTLDDLIDDDSGITRVFFSQLGFDELTYTTVIMEDIERHQYSAVHLLTYGVGQKIAELVENHMTACKPNVDFSITTVNPCTGREVLSQNFAFIPKIISLLFAMKYMLGWASIFIVIPTSSERICSLALFFDQLKAASKEWFIESDATHCVFLTRENMMVDNDKIKSRYKKARIYYV